MSGVLLKKIHAAAQEKVKEKELEIKASDPESWDKWIECFFEAARDIRDDFDKCGLLNSSAAMSRLIDQQIKTLNERDRTTANRIINAHELNA